MLRQLFAWIVGRRLENERLSEEKFSVFWGMPILSSDAISSVAYAVEEMLWILVPVIGMASYLWMPRIAISIILLMLILVFSYRQVVEAYPGGGGAYVVARDNLGSGSGLIAGAALSIDYTLTVAVSITAGTAAITSAFPQLLSHHVAISVLLVILVALGNIRGIRESSRLFSIPTYAFIAAVLALIIVGIIKGASATHYSIPEVEMSHVPFGTELVTIFLLMRAFSSGCSAVTGVEAISDAVPNFKEPPEVNAKRAYTLLAFAIIITFGGITYLTNVFHPVPTPNLTIIAQLAIDVFGRGGMFYFIQFATAAILIMAANTAFAGFPTLLSVIAQDRFVPRQFAMRGHRLNFNNGIAILAVLAIILVVIFQGSTHHLIPLYAIGVFTSFSLAQVGLLTRWFREKPDGWPYKAVVNSVGAAATVSTVLILGVTKFSEGAWVVVVVIPILVVLMLGIHGHYKSVARQLDISNEALIGTDLSRGTVLHVIVPIDSMNTMVVKALQYARTMTANVEAFHVEIYPGEGDKLRNKWALLNTDIPLVMRQSPYRDIVGPLVEYINSEDHASKPGDMITVMLPQFFVSKWWQTLLHNNTSIFIANAMFRQHKVVVSVLPFYLEADK
jgi:amino acid transporter